MATNSANTDGATAVRQLIGSLPAEEQQVWLLVVHACYDTAGQVQGEFAKAWVHGLEGLPLNLKKLQRYGILSHVISTRGKHRAYWRMVDREGVGRALKDQGCL